MRQLLAALLPLLPGWALLLSFLGAQGPPPPRAGVLISEAHGSGLPGGAGNFLELINIKRQTPSGGIDLAGGFVRIDVLTPLGPTNATMSFPTSPPTTFPGPPPGVLAPSFLVLAAQPTGAAHEILTPGLFQPVDQMLQPGSDTRITIFLPANSTHPEFFDQVIVNSSQTPPFPPLPGLPPGSPHFKLVAVNFPPPAAPPLPHLVPGPQLNRALFTRSFTAFDYETSTGIPSPGQLNPMMDHINGFEWDPPGQSSGVPFPVSPVGGGPAVLGTISLANQPVSAVRVDQHPDFAPRITHPEFDPILAAGVVNVPPFQIQGADQRLADATAPAGNTWSLTLPDPASPGVVTITSTVLNQIHASFQPSTTPGFPGPMIERAMIDNTTTPLVITAQGQLSDVQLDVLPENSGRDVWCEIIFYDMGGNAYKAKVLNWPPNPQGCAGSNTPFLNLTTSGTGDMDLVSFCFPPQAELYILPTLAGTGPFFGITPDALTLLSVTAPLGTDPLHVSASNDGIYVFGFGAGVFPTGSGLTITAVAVQFLPLSGSVGAVSNVAAVTF